VNSNDTVVTVVNGKVLMKDKKLTGLNEESIRAACKEEAYKLWKELGI
jgi:hypothetical protein